MGVMRGGKWRKVKGHRNEGKWDVEEVMQLQMVQEEAVQFNRH